MTSIDLALHQLHLSHRITAIIIIIVPIIIPTTITKIMIIMKIMKIIKMMIISFEPTGSALHLGRLEEGDGGVYRCQVDYSQVIVMVTILKMPMQHNSEDANATQF